MKYPMFLQMHGFRSMVGTILLTAGMAFGAASSWHMTPSGNLNFDIVLNGAAGPLYLSSSTPSWGPNWAYFGYGSSPTVVDGAYVYTNNLTISGAALSVRLEARRVGDTVQLEYTYTAGAADVAFTLVACGLSSQKNLAGGTMTALLSDGSTVVKTLPLSGRGAFPANSQVTRLSYVSTGGDPLVVDFNRPVSVANENNEVRLTLVGSLLAANTSTFTRLTFTYPQEPVFYARESDSYVRSDTAQWFSYPVNQYGVPIDLGFLNRDANGAVVPAGSHGFVETQGERFVFEDGLPVRFWGLNVTAAGAICSSSRATDIATKLAKMGVNLVRLHHIDSWSNPIVDYSHADGTSQHLKESSLASLDVLIAQLKSRGIYVVPDPWVQRYFKQNDGVSAWENFNKADNFHLHPYCFFDPRMGELIRQTVASVWTRTSTVSGLRWCDDPALAFTETANESLMQRGENHVTREPYKTQFKDLYQTWCAAHGVTPGAGDFIITNNYDKNNQKFYIEVLSGFFTTTAAHYKAAGLKIPIGGSNWYLWPWEVAANRSQDFLDSHFYYGGDQIGPGSGLGGNCLEHPPTLGNSPFSQIGGMALTDKPIISSECGNNPPKTYRATYPLALAGVGALQDWNGLIGYAFTQSGSAASTLSAYEWEADPVTMAMWSAGSLLFRRGDVQTAHETALMTMDDTEQYAFNWQNGGVRSFENVPGFVRSLEQHRTRLYWGATPPAGEEPDHLFTPQQAFDTPIADSFVRSDTGQLWRDWNLGLGTIDTNRTQAASGRFDRVAAPVQTSRARFTIQNPFACVVLTSAGWGSLETASQLYVIVSARAENTNQAANLAFTKITVTGAGPILCEPVVGSVDFRSSQPGYMLHPLSANGTRGTGRAVTVADGWASFTLLAADQTLFYELVSTGPTQDTFNTWVARQSTLPSGQQGGADDPDGDGLNNLLEYFVGADPAQPSAFPLTSRFENGQIRLAVPRSLLAGDVDYRFEWTGDPNLQNWRGFTPDQITVLPGSATADTITVTTTPPQTGASLFCRLVVLGY